ncbi:hypothetical protein A2127_00250 [Candidatus Jorgensenbacteria bacterium GWC1_48_12]|uniref:Uncharacterized protein n=1 Tax=Candidatus Jorgensenbacteria bacterium GWC1_48_12 TaxID=1798469 RepID=A0A1F6BR35_9BACT|nr:MAG: hypothetical protein A2127_00250 [Candidatus Jorgensenbacteria bacterium GWC1_48_12]
MSASGSNRSERDSKIGRKIARLSLSTGGASGDCASDLDGDVTRADSPPRDVSGEHALATNAKNRNTATTPKFNVFIENYLLVMANNQVKCCHK